MAKILPLYKDFRIPIELETPRAVDHDCRRCPLWGGASQPCMNAEGEPGGVLVIGEYPGAAENRMQRPFVDVAGTFLREALSTYWDGPVALDNALRCMPPKKPDDQLKTLPKNAISACRGYLAKTIQDAQPKRIIVMGGRAVQSVFADAIPVLSARHGVGWYYNDGECIPVFILMNPTVAISNQIYRRWFHKDLKWALTCDLKRQFMPPYDETYEVIQTVAESQRAIESFYRAGGMTYDVETAGRMHDTFFKLLCLGACAYEAQHAYVWDEVALADPEIAAPLFLALADPKLKKCGSNVKYDNNAVRCAAGVEVKGTDFDARLVRKMLHSNVSGYLEHMGYLVGMGGHKREMEHALVTACQAISKARQRDEKGKASGLLPGTEPEELIEAIKRPEWEPKSYAYGLVDKDLLHCYCALDVVATERLRKWQAPQLEKSVHINRIWKKVVRHATDAFSEMEHWGIPASKDAMVRYDQYLGVQLAQINKRFDQYKVNPASPQQIAHLLYDKLKLPFDAKSITGGGQKSTDNNALLKIRSKHPIVEDLIEHRALIKLKGTYASGLIPFIRDDGRIHPTFWIDGTETGRASCVARGTFIEIVRDVSKHPRGIPIEHVRSGDLAYAYTDSGELAIRPVTWAGKTGHKRVVRVHWQGSGHQHGGYVDLTPDHLVRLRTNEWKPAGGLQPGDRVYALSRGLNHGYARLWPTGTSEIREHCFIFSQVYGTTPEHVHHSNENKLDNRVANLEGLSRSAHFSLHGKKCSPELRVMRAAKMQKQWRSGSMQGLKGATNGRWLGLTKRVITDALKQNRWSVTLASAALRVDIEAFKNHAVRVGYDLKDLKKRNRYLRCQKNACSGNHEVIKVEWLENTTDVYDLVIEDTHNFIAGELCVHNCSDPGLHQMPRGNKNAHTKYARNCFIAHPGWRLLQADFGQLEYRIAALLSGDPVMKAAFRSGIDFHLRTAQLISQVAWGIRPEDCTKEHRSRAKNVNFGLLYGMTIGGLAIMLGCTWEEARVIKDAVQGTFHVCTEWSQRQIAEAERTGSSWTYWEGEKARRRPLPNIASNDSGKRNNARNAAVNGPVQGSSSEYCVRSLIECVDWIKADCVPSELVLTVHDSLMFHQPEEDVAEVAANVHRIMTSWWSGDVDILVDLEEGDSWGNLKKYQLPKRTS